MTVPQSLCHAISFGCDRSAYGGSTETRFWHAQRASAWETNDRAERRT